MRWGQNVNDPNPTWPLSRSGNAWDSDRDRGDKVGQHQESSSCLGTECSEIRNGKQLLVIEILIILWK